MTGAGPSMDGSGSTRPRHTRRGLGLALAALLVQIVGTTIAARGQPAELDVLGYALLVASGLALIIRRRFPAVTVVVTAASTVCYDVLGYPRGPTFVALIIAAVAAMRAGHHLLVWAAAILSFTTWVVLADARFGQALAVAAWTVGLGLPTEMLLGAVRIAGRLSQEQRRLFEERQRRQVSEERLRIAHELHDVLGHHLSLINVRAGVALHLKDRQPDQVWAALDTIKQTSAEALREVQWVLSAVHSSDQAASRTPAPRLERLDELTVDAGLSVQTTISGEPRPLPAEVDLAAYRIVQEALTNVRRHAGAGAGATVTIEYRQDELVVVQVDDDGGTRGWIAAPVVEGNGISGMRERAEALGGSLTVEPLPDGGWRVRALLPLPTPGPDGAP